MLKSYQLLWVFGWFTWSPYSIARQPQFRWVPTQWYSALMTSRTGMAVVKHLISPSKPHPVSISHKAFDLKIERKMRDEIDRSLWNLTGSSAAKQSCRNAFQFLDWSDNSQYKYHGIKISRHLTKRRLISYSNFPCYFFHAVTKIPHPPHYLCGKAFLVYSLYRGPVMWRGLSWEFHVMPAYPPNDLAHIDHSHKS